MIERYVLYKIVISDTLAGQCILLRYSLFYWKCSLRILSFMEYCGVAAIIELFSSIFVHNNIVFNVIQAEPQIRCVYTVFLYRINYIIIQIKLLSVEIIYIWVLLYLLLIQGHYDRDSSLNPSPAKVQFDDSMVNYIQQTTAVIYISGAHTAHSFLISFEICNNMGLKCRAMCCNLLILITLHSYFKFLFTMITKLDCCRELIQHFF